MRYYVVNQVIQVYISWMDCPVRMPQRQMVGVMRKWIPRSDAISVEFVITSKQMKIWDDDRGFIYHKGKQ